jgi:hypothetical protein
MAKEHTLKEIAEMARERRAALMSELRKLDRVLAQLDEAVGVTTSKQGRWQRTPEVRARQAESMRAVWARKRAATEQQAAAVGVTEDLVVVGI